jgi:hypothetical protein
MRNRWHSVNILVAVCFLAGLMPSGPLGTSANAASASPARSPARQSKVQRVRLYVAVLKELKATVLIQDVGTVSVKGGCLIVTVDGTDRTAVLPPYARLVGPLPNPTGIRMQRQTVPLGVERLLPAVRGLYITQSELKEPIPDHCPKAVEIFAG